MTKDEARLLLMDYLYGELDANAEKEFLEFIGNHANLQQELEELQDTRSVLAHLPVQSPAERLVITNAENSNESDSKWWQELLSALIPKSTFARTSFSVIAVVLMFTLTASLSNFSITSNTQGFRITFGEQPVDQSGFTTEQVQAIIEQVKKDNAILVTQVVTEAQRIQNQQIQQSLTDFAGYLEEQRASDLSYLSIGIAGLQESTFNRFKQTDQVLGEIIQTVSINK